MAPVKKKNLLPFSSFFSSSKGVDSFFLVGPPVSPFPCAPLLKELRNRIKRLQEVCERHGACPPFLSLLFIAQRKGECPRLDPVFFSVFILEQQGSKALRYKIVGGQARPLAAQCSFTLAGPRRQRRTATTKAAIGNCNPLP